MLKLLYMFFLKNIHYHIMPFSEQKIQQSYDVDDQILKSMLNYE